MTMFSFLLAVQILVSIGIVSLVMLQQGKGADMGAAFGSGASGTVFGSRGSGSFFTRATAVLAAVFFINCLLIASPLVRSGGDDDDSSSIASQLEETVKANQNDAAELLDEENGLSDGTATTPGQAEDMPEDMPGGDAATDTSGASDLPE